MNTSLDASISYIIENNLVAYRQLVLDNCAKPEIFPRRAIMSCDGKPISSMYFLLDGMIKVYTNNLHGYVRILGYHKKNTIFEMDGLIPNAPAVVTTESVTPISVIPVSEKDFLAINRINPCFLLDLAKYYCTVLRLMCFDAENQSICDAKVRLSNFLCLYARCQKQEEQGKVGMTQEDLASAVNCSRVQVARICADLRKEGIITTGRGGLMISDLKKLEALLDTGE